jgi:hypothetical protein
MTRAQASNSFRKGGRYQVIYNDHGKYVRIEFVVANIERTKSKMYLVLENDKYIDITTGKTCSMHQLNWLGMVDVANIVHSCGVAKVY